MDLNEFLDFHYGPEGDRRLRERLEAGEDPNRPTGPRSETALHVAARRRRCEACRILLDHGAAIDARTAGGKTAYAHAIRRGFDEVATLLAERGADITLNSADRLAVALAHDRIDEARKILAEHPGAARTGNPEEDRLLADLTGREETEPVELLIGAGADLAAGGLDGGTPLHVAAWFGQPRNARLLIEAGAPLDIFDPVHESTPLHWAIHGSRYSGGAEQRQDRYLELTRMLLDAGSALHYPEAPEGDAYMKRMLNDASPQVRELLEYRLPI